MEENRKGFANETFEPVNHESDIFAGDQKFEYPT
jgi:hypothetical protein